MEANPLIFFSFFTFHDSLLAQDTDWMVQDDLKPLDDSEEVLNLERLVNGSIPGREIISLLDGKSSQVVKRIMCSKKKEKDALRRVTPFLVWWI